MFTSVSNVVVAVVYRSTLSNKRTRLWLRVSRATKSGRLAVGPVNRVDQLFAELHLHEPMPNPVETATKREREMMPHAARCMPHWQSIPFVYPISKTPSAAQKGKISARVAFPPQGQGLRRCGRFPLLRMPLNCWAHAARILSKRCPRPSTPPRPVPLAVPLHLDVLLKVSCYFHRPQTWIALQFHTHWLCARASETAQQEWREGWGEGASWSVDSHQIWLRRCPKRRSLPDCRQLHHLLSAGRQSRVNWRNERTHTHKYTHSTCAQACVYVCHRNRKYRIQQVALLWVIQRN